MTDIGPKFYKKTLICLTAAVVVIIAVGCSDNPQDKAAKDLRAQTQDALDIAYSKGDFEKARKQIKTALARNGKSIATDTAHLALANLAYEQAQTVTSSLGNTAQPIKDNLKNISLKATALNETMIEMNRLENLFIATETEIAELNKTLNGDSANIGTKQKLRQAKADLDGLRKKVADLEETNRQASTNIDQIEYKADEKARQAELAVGDEKLNLKKQGYDLLLSKMEYTSIVQGTDDKTKTLQSKIAIVAPLVAKLETDVIKFQNKIKSIKSSPNNDQLRAQYREAKNSLEKHNAGIASLAGSLGRAIDSWNQETQPALSLFEQAADNYKKARASNIRDIAKASLADTYFAIASVHFAAIKLNTHVASQLQATALAISGSGATTLDSLGETCRENASAAAEKSMQNFDLAIETYAQLSDNSRNDKFTYSAIKGHLLALYGKMQLAEDIGETDLANSTKEQTTPLLEKAAECDPQFDTSITARLFNGSEGYIPALTIDSTTYYNGMKAMFQPWKALPLDQKEVAVNILIEMVDAMKNPRDPEEFNRIIGPEIKMLREALARGFEEEIADSGGYDPNSF
ncbi:MAG TPA: hypothetical protein ENH94_10270 [Phycisphaerales bacterium]|nr:hypothetical protein [Phycisphaerales bacterium]